MRMKLRVAMKINCVTMSVGKEDARGRRVLVAREGRASPQLAVSHCQSHLQLKLLLRVGQSQV